MYGNYTQAANDRCYNVLDQDIYDIWDAVESLSDDESAECWKEKCEKLAYEYSFSSRFALMRILYSRVQGCTLSEAESDDGFSLEIAGEEYFLSAVNMEHAEEMDEKEIKQYENILNEMAKMRPDADVDPNVSKYLIAKALKDASEATELAIADLSDDVTAIEKRKIKKESKTLLSRAEAMKLGHILGFTLDEMSWFLLRVFDFEDGFRYNSSGDLIEAYGFITGTSWQHVETIKEKYKKLTQNILKSGVLEREADWTQSAGDSLKGKVEKWSVRPEEQEEQFMMWLKQRASCLDLPSRTASHIYQKLAVYIYEISEQNIRTPNRKTFIYKLKELCSQNSSYQKTVYEYLGEKNQSIIEKCLALGETFLRNERKQREQEEEEKKREERKQRAEAKKNGIEVPKKKRAKKKEEENKEYCIFDGQVLDVEKCKKISRQLLEENKNMYLVVQDRVKAWRTVSSNESGMSQLIVDSTRKRIRELLMGEQQVEKRDILHLLWFGFNLCWVKEPIENNMTSLQYNFADFTETVKIILDKALLFDFYPPHLMEQSMMLSIIASVENLGVPAYSYEDLCESLIKKK